MAVQPAVWPDLDGWPRHPPSGRFKPVNPKPNPMTFGFVTHTPSVTAVREYCLPYQAALRRARYTGRRPRGGALPANATTSHTEIRYIECLCAYVCRYKVKNRCTNTCHVQTVHTAALASHDIKSPEEARPTCSQRLRTGGPPRWSACGGRSLAQRRSAAHCHPGGRRLFADRGSRACSWRKMTKAELDVRRMKRRRTPSARRHRPRPPRWWSHAGGRGVSAHSTVQMCGSCSQLEPVWREALADRVGVLDVFFGVEMQPALSRRLPAAATAPHRARKRAHTHTSTRTRTRTHSHRHRRWPRRPWQIAGLDWGRAARRKISGRRSMPGTSGAEHASTGGDSMPTRGPFGIE